VHGDGHRLRSASRGGWWDGAHQHRGRWAALAILLSWSMLSLMSWAGGDLPVSPVASASRSPTAGVLSPLPSLSSSTRPAGSAERAVERTLAWQKTAAPEGTVGVAPGASRPSSRACCEGDAGEVAVTQNVDDGCAATAEAEATTVARVNAARTAQAEATERAIQTRAARSAATSQAMATVAQQATVGAQSQQTSEAVAAAGFALTATASAGAVENTATATVAPLTPEQAASPVIASGNQPRPPRLILATYFTWFDDSSWDDCNISAGDRPLQPYHSDDPAAIRRHVQMALDSGIDGFTVHWFAPGERTDRNFATMLAQSEGTGLRSTVMFLRHIWHGSPAPTQENVVEALRYVAAQYGGHPNFLRVDGRPVLFFTDMYRVPRASGQSPQQAWAAIRGQVDPQRGMLWIAEGLDPSYLEVFDGLYVYKITHADYPDDYLKARRWAAQVRQWAERTGQPKLWIATICPGLDDLRAGCKADVRVPSKPHKRDREDGAFYRATFAAAMSSDPDWILVQSFNEWVEGTYIEPSNLYGDKYMQMTREFASQFKK